jgi:hypothetical protein
MINGIGSQGATPRSAQVQVDNDDIEDVMLPYSYIHVDSPIYV